MWRVTLHAYLTTSIVKLTGVSRKRFGCEKNTLLVAEWTERLKRPFKVIRLRDNSVCSSLISRQKWPPVKLNPLTHTARWRAARNSRQGSFNYVTLPAESKWAANIKVLHISREHRRSGALHYALYGAAHHGSNVIISAPVSTLSNYKMQIRQVLITRPSDFTSKTLKSTFKIQFS